MVYMVEEQYVLTPLPSLRPRTGRCRRTVLRSCCHTNLRLFHSNDDCVLHSQEQGYLLIYLLSNCFSLKLLVERAPIHCSRFRNL